MSHVDLTVAAAVMPDGPSGRLPSHPHLHLFCTGHKKKLRCMDECMDVWMNEWMDVWIDGSICCGVTGDRRPEDRPYGFYSHTGCLKAET